jgi:hypothetical protein
MNSRGGATGEFALGPAAVALDESDPAGEHDTEVVGRIALAEQHLSDRGGPDHTVPMQERELLVAQLGDVEWIGVADRESLHHAPLPRSFSARRPCESMGAVALPLPP